jgi:succinate dehydrogenase / fumarate reductase cytochrome b subunit
VGKELSITRDKVRPRQPLRSWFDVRRRQVGSWAFALNRLTGLALTFYLFLHLGILTILLQGESAWNDFVALVKSPLFLILDVVLLIGLIFHGLNGIRVALVGMGFVTEKQRSLFWGLMVVGLLLLFIASWLIFTL